MKRQEPLKITEVAELLGTPAYQVRRAIYGGYLKAYSVTAGEKVHRLVELSDLLEYATKYNLPKTMIDAIKKRMKR